MTHVLHPSGHARFRPTTTLGVRSVRLVVTGVWLTLSFSALIALSADRPFFHLAPYVALVGLMATLVGGAMAFVAVIRDGDRSIAAIATLPLFAIALVVFLGELAQLLAWLL